MVIYGTLLLTDPLFGGNFCMQFHRKFFVCSYTAQKEITPHVKWSLIICVQSTLALRTPRYNGHPDNTDSS